NGDASSLKSENAGSDLRPRSQMICIAVGEQDQLAHLLGENHALAVRHVRNAVRDACGLAALVLENGMRNGPDRLAAKVSYRTRSRERDAVRDHADSRHE